MKKEMQARTPFLFKMGVHSYYNCGIRSEDHFCSLNELKETASPTKAEFQEKSYWIHDHTPEVLGPK